MENDDDETFGMKAVEEHRVSGFCCYRVASDEKYHTLPEVYSGCCLELDLCTYSADLDIVCFGIVI